MQVLEEYFGINMTLTQCLKLEVFEIPLFFESALSYESDLEYVDCENLKVRSLNVSILMNDATNEDVLEYAKLDPQFEEKKQNGEYQEEFFSLNKDDKDSS
jgi:hypothetical protein